MSRFDKDDKSESAKEHARLMREIKDRKSQMRKLGK